MLGGRKIDFMFVVFVRQPWVRARIKTRPNGMETWVNRAGRQRYLRTRTSSNYPSSIAERIERYVSGGVWTMGTRVRTMRDIQRSISYSYRHAEQVARCCSTSASSRGPSDS